MLRLVIIFLFILQSLSASAYCHSVSIKTDKQFVCGPGLFRFELQGATNAKQIIWNFGDGEKTAPDSLYQYLFKYGKYHVNVKILWPDGSRCDTTFLNLVEVRQLPVPKVQLSRQKLCDGPDTVLFTCINKGMKSISWIVDGTNYFNAGAQIAHKFVSTGSKSYNIILVDSSGCRGIADEKDAIVIFEKPFIHVSRSDSSGCSPVKVKFGADIILSGQQIISTLWTLPGTDTAGNNSISPPVKTYSSAGNYDVSLKNITDKGCVYQINHKDFVKVGDSLPVKVNKPKPFYCFNEWIILSDAISKTGGSYTWNYPANAQVRGDSTGNFIIFKIADGGAYKITVTYEKNGCKTYAELKDTIKIKQVKADFTSKDNFHCQVPLTVHFINTSWSNDTANFIYQWYFYKKGTNTPVDFNLLKDPSVVFNDMGEYDARLIIKHKTLGCSDTITKTSFIRIDTIRPDMVIYPNPVCANQQVSFMNATLPSSYLGKDTFYWKIFGTDGKTIIRETDSFSFVHTFNYPGLYKVSLFAGNNSGCTYKKTIFDTVDVVVPKLNFFVIPQNVCMSDPLRLAAATTPTRVNFMHNWTITGNGNQFLFSTKDSVIRLDKIGLYDVKYQIELAGGCKDSLTKKQLIGINGIDARIKLDTSTGCLPFEVKPTLPVLKNYFRGVSDSSVTIKWFATPSNGVTISNDSIFNPVVIFDQVGLYQINAVLTNAAGCDTIITSDTIFAGVDASFVLNDYRVCVGDVITASANSKLKPSSYYWTVNDANVSLSSHTDSVIKISTLNEGKYKLTLVAEKNKVCFDTATVPFEVIKVVASFETLDTLLTCAPVYAQFLSTSKNADRLIWNFGDGQQFITSLPTAGHVYRANSGWHQGFDIVLLAENDEGCSDVVRKDNLVWVLGPVPDFTMTNIAGCDPLTVSFQNKSRDAVRYQFDFGDNVLWDSTIFQNEHTYHMNQLKGDTQYFIPRLFAHDSLGCISAYEPFDKVAVYRKPNALIQIPESACQNQMVQLINQTPNAIKHIWIIDGVSGPQDSIPVSISMQFENVANHQILFIAENYLGCRDSQFRLLPVNPKIVSEITQTDTACLNKQLQLHSAAKSAASIKSNNWFIKQLDAFQFLYEGATCNYQFNNSGSYIFQLVAGNQFNCFDTSHIEVYVEDPQLARTPQIIMASVLNARQAEVISLPSPNNRFASMETFHNGQKTDVSYTASRIKWTGQPFDTVLPAHCYTLTETDVCGYKKSSEPHCPVILHTGSSEAYTNYLWWSAYKGWERVDAYLIHRSFNGQPFEIIASVAPAVLNYTDSPLCPGNYIYQISAVNGDDVSMSNMASQIPKYTQLSQGIDIRSIKVINNNSLLVSWDKATESRHLKYEIEKRPVGNASGNAIEKISANDTFLMDYAVNPTKMSYHYQVNNVDICGEKNVTGNFGESILLKGVYNNNAADISWNNYKLWDYGVKLSMVQLACDNDFKTLDLVSGKSDNYADKEIHQDISGYYCYRVVSVSETDARDTSVSNTLCLAGPSVIYIPNSFTPDNDGKNDIFRPVMHFINNEPENAWQQYEFTIFNRWGEILFRTEDPEQGWDGNYDGKPSQGGVYAFKLKVYGLDGNIYNKSGTVHLLR